MLTILPSQQPPLIQKYNNSRNYSRVRYHFHTTSNNNNNNSNTSINNNSNCNNHFSRRRVDHLFIVVCLIFFMISSLLLSNFHCCYAIQPIIPKITQLLLPTVVAGIRTRTKQQRNSISIQGTTTITATFVGTITTTSTRRTTPNFYTTSKIRLSPSWQGTTRKVTSSSRSTCCSNFVTSSRYFQSSTTPLRISFFPSHSIQSSNQYHYYNHHQKYLRTITTTPRTTKLPMVLQSSEFSSSSFPNEDNIIINNNTKSTCTDNEKNMNNNYSTVDLTTTAVKSVASLDSTMSVSSTVDNATGSGVVGRLGRAVITDNIQLCGERITNNLLVAFPTETVYGLGANALNEQAVLSIFHAKERPHTDPLIVHILNTKDAFQLWDAIQPSEQPEPNSNHMITEGQILQILCDTFWPGPLTIVARANTTIVPSVVMAHTKYCACRVPVHPIARKLLQATYPIPIAAPSANKFGHVSPTSYEHVYHDLYNEDVYILKDINKEQQQEQHQETDEKEQQSIQCEVGVESTVVKVEVMIKNHNHDTDPQQQEQFLISVLRQGAISIQSIQQCLYNHPLLIEALTSQNDNNKNDNDMIIRIESNIQRTTQDHVATVAPGQTIKHYSPSIPSFIVAAASANDNNNKSTMAMTTSMLEKEVKDMLQYAVILDYGCRLVHYKPYVLQYYDLSPTNDSMIAAQQVFDKLRWTEQIINARILFFPEINILQNENDNVIKQSAASSPPTEMDALTLAIKDRLTRAASGVVVQSLLDERIRNVMNKK